ncbi:unnamed protein product, partial [marine sediment metagenome]
MAGKFNYEVRHKYPNLFGKDKEVWDRFIQKYPDLFDTVDYSVKIIVGPEILPLWDKKSSDFWDSIAKKTIDVIGRKKNSVTI